MHAATYILIVAAFLAAAVPAPADVTSRSVYTSANRQFQGQNYREALDLYRKALAAPPAGVSAGDIHRRMGDAYFQLGDFRSALVSYRSAVADPAYPEKAQAQYWTGFCCFLLGRDAEAVNELLKVPQLYPEAAAWSATAYYWAGRASERMGRKDLSAEYYRKAAGSGSTTQGRFARKKAEAVKGK